MSAIIFTTVKAKGDNRKPEVDENGYYRVNLGGINTFNSAGEFYTAKGVKELIESSSSSLNRRLTSGFLKGEAGHPEYVTGMSKADFFNRNMKILLPNISHHIREIILTPSNEPSGVPGQGNFILIEGWVKPAGPYGDALKASLDNPEENTAFSIRSFTNNSVFNGITIKQLAQIITWDWVLEPGIDKATKWKKLSIESRDIISISTEEISEPDGSIRECFNCSLESAEIRSMVKETIDNCNTNNESTNIIINW